MSPNQLSSHPLLVSTQPNTAEAVRKASKGSIKVPLTLSAQELAKYLTAECDDGKRWFNQKKSVSKSLTKNNNTSNPNVEVTLHF